MAAQSKYTLILCAGVAELVDAPDSKSGDGNIVWVRLPPSVPINIFICKYLYIKSGQPHLTPKHIREIPQSSTQDFLLSQLKNIG